MSPIRARPSRCCRRPARGEYITVTADADRGRCDGTSVSLTPPRCPIYWAVKLPRRCMRSADADAAVVFVEPVDGSRRAYCRVYRLRHGRGKRRWCGRRDTAIPTATARSRSSHSAADPDGPSRRPDRNTATVGPCCGQAAADDGPLSRAKVSPSARRATVPRLWMAPSIARSSPLLPGFLSASAVMTHVVEQIQRLQGSDF